MKIICVKAVLVFSIINLFLSCSTVKVKLEPRMIPQDIAGMVHAGGSESEKEILLLREFGVAWVRNDFAWDVIEREKGVWDFSSYDAEVEQNKKNGIKQLGVLGFDTAWLHKDLKKKQYISVQELQQFIEYVEKTVTHYKGKVEAWEIWNEPNVGVRFWKGPTKDFYVLSKAAAKKIRECDPSAKIIAGSFWLVPTSFINNMFKSGAFDDVDGISFHPYGVNPKHVAKLYDRFTAILKKQNFSGEIWITEIGYPTGGIYPNRVQENKFGEYIHDTFIALAERGARVIFWYHLYDKHTKDSKPKSLNSERFFGLLYNDYEKKIGVDAFAKTIADIAGKEYPAKNKVLTN